MSQVHRAEGMVLGLLNHSARVGVSTVLSTVHCVRFCVLKCTFQSRSQNCVCQGIIPRFPDHMTCRSKFPESLYSRTAWGQLHESLPPQCRGCWRGLLLTKFEYGPIFTMSSRTAVTQMNCDPISIKDI